MNAPWEPAIPQAFQRHGGSNRNAKLRLVPAVPSPTVAPEVDHLAELPNQAGSKITTKPAKQG